MNTRLVARIATLAALLACGLEACSLFVPFDDYEGPPLTANPDAPGPGRDASPILPDAPAPTPVCAGVDLASDRANCGACGRSCPSGACTEGRCPLEDVVDAGAIVQAIAPVGDAPDLFFQRQGADIGRFATATGSLFVQTDAGARGPLVARAANGFYGKNASIAKFEPATFGVVSPTTFAVAQGQPAAVAAIGSLVYWSDPGGVWWRDVQAGGGPEDGIEGLLGASPPAIGFAVSDGSLFWAAADGTVRAMQALNPRSPPAVLQPDAFGAVSAMGALRNTEHTYLYLCQPGQGLHVYEHVPAGSARIATLPMEDCEAIAVTETAVYATNFGRSDVSVRRFGEIWRTALDGGQAILLAKDITATRGLAASGPYVYFGHGTSIARTAR